MSTCGHVDIRIRACKHVQSGFVHDHAAPKFQLMMSSWVWQSNIFLNSIQGETQTKTPDKKETPQKRHKFQAKDNKRPKTLIASPTGASFLYTGPWRACPRSPPRRVLPQSLGHPWLQQWHYFPSIFRRTSSCAPQCQLPYCSLMLVNRKGSFRREEDALMIQRGLQL